MTIHAHTNNCKKKTVGEKEMKKEKTKQKRKKNSTD
jgi:hypothetical protein